MAAWHGPEGIRVEVIVLNKRTCLRVSQVVNGRRYHQAYCSLAELPQHVDLADLVEVIYLPRRSASRP
ncbi:hypothetical protein ACGFNP_25110 [Nonomuraea sp. NPDC049269]|uniref:hypothetical protein n=1 Tax=Nonomuraea sp. NPDC049269 TaxID=3364349 RepID=UPI003715F634